MLGFSTSGEKLNLRNTKTATRSSTIAAIQHGKRSLRRNFFVSKQRRDQALPVPGSLRDYSDPDLLMLHRMHRHGAMRK